MSTNSAPLCGRGVRRIPQVLTDKEQAALLSAPNLRTPVGLRNFVMLSIFLNLGLRVSEALNLKIEDVDPESGKLIVRAGKGNRDRTLWISEQDLAALKKWYNNRPAASDYVFSTLKGSRMSDRYVRDFVKRYGQKKQIKKDVHPHTLRHTFATDLLRETNNIRLVQKALGHVSISTTMIYTHIVDEQLELALKNLRN